MKHPKLGGTPARPSDLPDVPPSLDDLRQAVCRARTMDREPSTARMVSSLEEVLAGKAENLWDLDVNFILMGMALIGSIRSWDRFMSEMERKHEDLN